MSSPQTRISIITPSYNQGAYIEETILSIKNQHYRAYEHIIIDGKSTDATVTILKRYEGRYPMRWISEPDTGQSHAINKGITVSVGDIIAYINSDDTYATTDVFQKVVDFFDAHPDVGMIYGNNNIIDEHGRVLRHIEPPDFSYARLMRGGYITQPTVFFRKKHLACTGLFDETLTYAMDIDMWFRMHRQGVTIRNIAIDIANFRIHRASKTTTATVPLLWEGYWRVRCRYSHNVGLIAWSFLKTYCKTLVRKVVQ